MRQALARLILLGSATLLLLSACGGGGSDGGGNPQPANIAPSANAGAPQTVNAGATVTLNGTASSDSDGSIAAYAWTQTVGPGVALSNLATAQPSFLAPQGGAVTTLTFTLVVTDNRGGTSVPATVTITVIPPVAGGGTFSGVVRYTRIGFLNVSPFGLDFGSVLQRPARGVIVRALDANTQVVLATSVTDASGGYTFTVASNISVSIQVVARLQRDNTQPLPRWDVRVQDGVPGTNPYTFTSAAFNSNVSTQDVVIPSGFDSSGNATGVRASGPFAILDTLYTAIQAVTGVAPTANFPALIVDWGSQTAGTFFSTSGGQHIALMGDLTEDTDEFDQHVVAHEFGHYIERNFSRSDSIGGPHAVGDLLDPRVAFGEGFGYAFAAIVLNDPLVRDTYFDQNGAPQGGGFSVEINPPNLSTAGPGCWCSETSVWSILWDLYDSSSDGSDGITLGLGPIWEVLTSTAPTTSHRATPAVTSIFSFITALKAAQPGQAAAIDTLVSAQNIVASTINAFAATETTNPLTPPNNALPVFTDIVVGTPVVLRSTGSAERRYNKLGNRRFLRFTPASTGTVTLTLSTTNTAPTRDPDFLVFSSGALVRQGTNSSAEYPETETFSVTGGSTYIIDAYDCANGCDPDEPGTQGDYDLTVTIN